MPLEIFEVHFDLRRLAKLSFWRRANFRDMVVTFRGRRKGNHGEPSVLVVQSRLFATGAVLLRCVDSWQVHHFGHSGNLRRALIVTFGHVARFQKSWQAQYFVDLEVQISWQAHYFVDLEM